MSKNSDLHVHYQEEVYYSQAPAARYYVMTPAKPKLNIIKKLKQLSDWIDEKLFPVPATQLDRIQKEQSDIEQSANAISRRISKCSSIRYSYELHDEIDNFKAVWGKSAQVIAWHGSLMVQLRRRQKEIVLGK